MKIEGETLRTVVGENVQRIRQTRDVRQADLAAALRERGVAWSWNRISELEAGKKNVSVEQLVILADALGATTNQEVGLAHLLDGEGRVKLSDAVAVDRGVLAQYFLGEHVEMHVLRDNSELREAAAEAWGRVSENLGRAGRLMGERGREVRVNDPDVRPGTAEVNLARKLDEKPLIVQAAAIGLWGRSLTAERDARSGSEGDPASIAARRGRITRDLQGQIRERIEAERRGELLDPKSRLVSEAGEDGVAKLRWRAEEG